MNDFKGNEIHVGDTVIAAVRHGRNSGASLVEFVVTGFTKTWVLGVIPSYIGYSGQGRISPDKIYVIKKAE